MTISLSNRFQFAAVWGKEYKEELVQARGLDNCKKLEFLLQLRLVRYDHESSGKKRCYDANAI